MVRVVPVNRASIPASGSFSLKQASSTGSHHWGRSVISRPATSFQPLLIHLESACSRFSVNLSQNCIEGSIVCAYVAWHGPDQTPFPFVPELADLQIHPLVCYPGAWEEAFRIEAEEESILRMEFAVFRVDAVLSDDGRQYAYRVRDLCIPKIMISIAV